MKIYAIFLLTLLSCTNGLLGGDQQGKQQSIYRFYCDDRYNNNMNILPAQVCIDQHDNQFWQQVGVLKPYVPTAPKNLLETATEKLGGAISANPVIDWMAWTTVMCSVTEFAYLMMQPGSLSLLPFKWAALGFLSSIVGKQATVDKNTYASSYAKAAGNGVLFGFLAAWYSKYRTLTF